jgi:multiple sugar transport system permease protein
MSLIRSGRARTAASPAAATPPPPRSGHDHAAARRRARRRENLAGYAFMAPWFVGLGLIVLVPMVWSLYLAFTDYSLLESPRWVGADNFVRMFTADDRFIAAVKATLIYVFLSVPLQLAFALLLAIVLNQGVRGLAIYRGIYYLPSLLGGSVAIAILWRQVFGTAGIVNWVLDKFGATGPEWIANPKSAIYTLVVLNVWTFGSPMIIFLAGLRQIPQMYYEAAAVDGAGRTRRFLHITLPLLTPIIFFNLVLQVINAFQAFTPAFIISDGTGGPVDSTLFYTLYLYQEGFTRFRMGYASALAWVLFIVIAVFTAVNFLTSRFWVFYEDDE